MNPGGKVITFYSYKGGTGRTMALANVAVMLAQRDQGKVLMIDWDLEAPGLHAFFPQLAKLGDPDHSQPGVLELFEAAQQVVGGEPTPSSAFQIWGDADFDRHITNTEVSSLDLMPAGAFGDGYASRVVSVPWQQLFVKSPELFKVFAEELARRYSYILIDSRTGITDAGGVCSTLIPDHLVLVFTPNRQSLDGVLDLARRSATYRSQSLDLRPLLIFPLASRVEMSEDEMRQEWRFGGREHAGYQSGFESVFKEVYDLPSCDLAQYFDEIQIQHVSRYAYGEQIAVRDETTDRLSIARSYEQFTDVLVDNDGPWTFERRSRDIINRDDREHLVERIVQDCKTHWRIASRQRRRNTVLIGLEIALLATAVVICLGRWISAQMFPEEFVSVGGELLPILIIGVILAGGLEFFRRVFAFDRRGAIHARTGNALDREQTLFEGVAGPYADVDSPLKLLAERYGEIKMQAEDALLEHGSAVEIGRIRSAGDGDTSGST